MKMLEILIPVLICLAIAAVCAIVLTVSTALFGVKEDEKFLAIRDALPGANCGACGYSGCDGYAKALAEGETERTNLCTPGGDPTAAEGIVSYLQSKFNGDIRVIVPHMAMSAGTLISCAAKSILMGKHSFLGPVDAQVGGLGLLNAIKEFEDAREDMMLHPETANYWSIRLSKYPRSFYYYAKDGIALGDELLSKWLKNYMFAGESDNETKKKINRIKNKLNSNNKSHGRHFSFQDCVDMGLKVEALEDDSELQDLVLSVHHAFDITLANFPCAKIIENQLGANYEVNVAPQQ
jgi:hypothetical protein